MISLTDVHVKFGINTPLETHALRGINLNIKEGEFVTVIGSNGAGKSSLLNALSGEIVITSGKVEIANKDVTKLDTSRRAGMVARVFQDPLGGSCEFLSIEENLALADVRGHKRGFKQDKKTDLDTYQCLCNGQSLCQDPPAGCPEFF